MNTNLKIAERKESGSGLIEVLIALVIMMFLLVGVLQMFSYSFLINVGSAERTEMIYKCKDVVENLRYVEYSRRNSITLDSTIDPTNTIPTFTDGLTETLPTAWNGTDFAFWGPNGANVLGQGSSSSSYVLPGYDLSYTVTDGSHSGQPDFWIVTVTAVPHLHDDSAKRYHGIGVKHKRVDYVAQIKK